MKKKKENQFDDEVMLYNIQWQTVQTLGSLDPCCVLAQHAEPSFFNKLIF